MVLVDNFVSTPFFFNPSYYAIKSVLEGLSSAGTAGAFREPSPPTLALILDLSNWHFWMRRAYERYAAEWFEVCCVTWAFWIPLHAVTFSIVPLHWRVPFTATCSGFTLVAQSLNQRYYRAITLVAQSLNYRYYYCRAITLVSQSSNRRYTLVAQSRHLSR